MCKKVSAVPTGLAKVAAVLVFFCFVDSVVGSCSDYGHTCYGGHGKRAVASKAPTKLNLDYLPGDSRWFFGRLLKDGPNERFFRISDKAYNDIVSDSEGEDMVDGMDYLTRKRRSMW